jgi:probable F420-dependent oxidoreductase
VTRKETRFGIGLPQVFAEGGVDVEEILRSAVEAEQAGMDSLWTQSQTITTGTAITLDPISLLSFVAAVTSRVRLGTSVIIATEHHPVQLAKLLASLDQLSRGRLMVGFGTGAPHLRVPVHGLDTDRPVRWLVETIETCQRLWTGEPVSFDGELWQFRDVKMLPMPYQRPHPPIWIGAHQETALRRSVRLGDGWMGPGAHSVDEFRATVKLVRRFLDELGRDQAGFTIAKRMYMAVEPDVARATRRLEARFQAYSQDPERATTVCVFGPESRIVDEIGAVIEAGADLVLLNPVYDFVEQQRALYDLLRTHFGVRAPDVPADPVS